MGNVIILRDYNTFWYIYPYIALRLSQEIRLIISIGRGEGVFENRS